MDNTPQDDRRRLLRQALEAVETLKGRVQAFESEPIAIVGAACRFPGNADTIEAYWDLIVNGRDAVAGIPDHRTAWWKEKIPGVQAGIIGGLDQFDPAFFSISAREALTIDPQQRLVLEVGWHAFEHAGYNPRSLEGSLTGVYIGVGNNDYGDLLRESGELSDVYAATGNSLNAIPGRLSFVLGLQGPCVAIDTACSSSLVAIHLACQALRAKECDAAIAGGVNVILDSHAFRLFSKWGMTSPNGRCKTFDAAADGFVRAEGCGLVVLKRLSNAIASRDNILGIIRASAVNQDGRSSGLTVPNGPAQEALIKQALTRGRVKPEEISYVEAHGTATPIGDPIEAHAIGAVLGQGRTADKPLIVGSVKTNLGHLEAAAGVAGLLKVVLAMQKGRIPPNLNFRELNPNVDWAGAPVRVPTAPMEWPSGPRLAGVSGFGFSGVNAHIVLEEAPAPQKLEPVSDRPRHVLVLCARTPTALRTIATEFAKADLPYPTADVCFTANSGRASFNERLTVTGSSVEELQAKVRAANITTPERRRNTPKFGFLFTGQGSQYPGMGRSLYETQPTFRQALERCDALLRPHLQESLLEVLYGTKTNLLEETTYTQPALFAIEWAMAGLWQSWGIRPSVVLGHSVGEYAAAAVAGFLSLEDGLRLIAERARLMGGLGSGWGMITAQCSPEQVADVLPPRVSIAAVNAPDSLALSGPLTELAQVNAELTARGIRVTQLPVSHGFHSAQMDPILDSFKAVARSVEWQSPKAELISSLTGELVSLATLQDPDYWARQLRRPVQFQAALKTAAAQGCTAFIEVGPSAALCGLGRRVAPTEVWLPSLRPPKNDWDPLLECVAQVSQLGGKIDWLGFDAPYKRTRVPLPGYPFERQQYWVDFTAKKAEPRDGAGPFRRKEIQSPAIAGTVHQFEISESHASVAGHRINNSTLFPLTGYVQLLAESNLRNVGSLFVEQGLPLADGQEVSLQVVQQQGKASIYRREESGTWTLQVTAQTAAADSSDPESLQSLRSRIVEPIDCSGFYDWMRQAGVEYGESYRLLQEVWQSDRAVLSRLNAAADFAPGLDACTHALMLLLDTHGLSGSFLPAGIDSVNILRDLTGVLWSHIHLTEISADAIAADIRVYAETGEVIALLRGFRAKRIANKARHLLLDRSWKRSELVLSASSSPGAWLLIGDPTRTNAIAEQLRGHGAEVHSANSVPEAAPLLLRDWQGIVFMAPQAQDPRSLLEPLYKLFQTERSDQARIWIVTENAQAMDGTPVEPLQSAVWGMAASLAAEYPQHRVSLLDIDPNGIDSASLAQELVAGGPESRIALRDGQRYVERLTRRRPRTPHMLTTTGSGVLGNLTIVPMARREPGPGEVEVRVLAAGLNFRDVLSALGLVPGMEGIFGAECAGVVERVGPGSPYKIGDAVMAFVAPSFASYATLPSDFCTLKPDNLTFVQAAALPVVFLTCMHGLETLAQLRADETVLIHSGTGGVGLAAIQIARHIGANVIATAGSEEKRRYLRNLGIEFVFDSHSPDFARQTLDATGGRGADVVLNALTGDLIAAGFEALAKGGRFVELGKRDIWTPEQVAARRPDASYFVFDFGDWASKNAAATQKLLKELAGRLNARQFKPLPVQTFDNAQDAFRTMAQTNHVGKLVVTESSEAWMTQLHPHPDAQYLITGGLGAIGLHTAEWLASKGARHLTLVGRSQPSQPATDIIQGLQDRGIDVSIRALDVADATQVDALVAEIRQSGNPLRGVFHSAGVLDDGVVKEQSWDRVQRVLAPKMQGAENLHRATKHDQLDYFVLYSSASAVLGSPGQTSYAAGNAYMDGLALRRRAQGLPAISVNWGPWASSGMAARLSDQQQRRLSQGGSRPIQPRDAFDALEAALADLPPRTVVLDVDWSKLSSNDPFYADLVQPDAQSVTSASGKTAELRNTLSQATPEQREQILVDYVTSAVSAVCGFPASEIKPFQLLTEFGIDSLAALELRNRIQADLSLSIAVSSLLAGHSVTEVAAELAAGWVTSDAGSAASVPSGTAIEYPLTYGQQGLWFLQKMDPEMSAFNLPVCLRVSPHLDAPILERALAILADRHEALRTVFLEHSGQPVQRTVSNAPIDFRVIDLQSEATSEILLAEARRPLTLDKPLVRATLFPEPHADILLLSIHHLVADGWSLLLLSDELFRIYDAQNTGGDAMLAPTAARYQDFVASQEPLLTSAEGEKMWAFWREQLERLPQTLRIPGKQRSANMLRVRGDIARAAWTVDEVAQFHLFAQERNTTLYVIVLSALRMLLYQTTGLDDLAIGTPVSGRTRPEWQQVVGYFVNMLPIRLRFQPEDSFDRLVERSRSVVVAALANQDFPFQAIVERLKVARDTTRTPILQVALNVLQLPRLSSKAGGLDFGERKVEPLAIPNMAGQFELGFEVQELPTGAILELKYDADLIDREMAERMLSGLTAILRAAILHPHLPALALLARAGELSEQEQIEL